MLNACSVLFSRDVYTQSFIHMLTFFHTHMLLLNVIISVLTLWFIWPHSHARIVCKELDLTNCIIFV